MITEAELAYAAGFFDGEGHICIRYQKARPQALSDRYARYGLFCQVSQVRREPIDWFRDKFGGWTGARIGKRSYDQGIYERFDWQVSSQAAARFLTLVRPWLIVKAAEADIALAFQGSMGKRSQKTPPEVVAYRQECFEQIKQARRI